MNDNNANSRTVFLENFLKQFGANPDSMNVEHVWKGAPGNRSMTSVSIVEFASRDIRERILKNITAAKSKLLDNFGKEIAFGRAKTAFQRKRNESLKKAAELLKKDSLCEESTMKIVWKAEDGSKIRFVNVGERPIFIQNVADVSGIFKTPFDHLSVV